MWSYCVSQTRYNKQCSDFAHTPQQTQYAEQLSYGGEHSTTPPTDDAYPEANTFYIYFFTCKKLERVMEAMKHIQEFTGGRVRVCEFVLRPTLWPLYDKAFPNYFNAEGGVALGEGEETDSEAADTN